MGSGKNKRRQERRRGTTNTLRLHEDLQHDSVGDGGERHERARDLEDAERAAGSSGVESGGGTRDNASASSVRGGRAGGYRCSGCACNSGHRGGEDSRADSAVGTGSYVEYARLSKDASTLLIVCGVWKREEVDGPVHSGGQAANDEAAS